MPVSLRGWRLVAGFGTALGAVWVVLGGLARGFSGDMVLFHAVTGFLLGAAAAPELELSNFVYARFWQVGVAVSGCVIFAVSIGADPVGYLVAVVIGVLVGYTFHYWFRYASP
jgi:hypothetical protein